MRGGFFRFVKNAFLVMVGTVLLLGLVAYSQGAVMVYVHEKKPSGVRMFLPIPSLVVTAGLGFIPAETLQGKSRELRQWLPAIRLASQELAHSPDGLLVEVTGRKEHVLIAKHADDLLIDVDDENETVHLSLPIETIGVVADHLAEDQAPI